MSGGQADSIDLEKLRDGGAEGILASQPNEHAAEDRPQLLPTTRQDGQPGGNPPAKQNLAFLDGLRGIAALAVYFQHHITEYYGSDCDILHAYGYEGRYHIAALPFLRPFFAGGAPAVMIFFVLSGYVLSRGALRMLRDGENPNNYLITALLRRPIRLWLPPIIVSLPVVFLLHTPLRPLNSHVAREPNIFAEIWYFIVALKDSINPFRAHGPWHQMLKYDPPVWTMAYEMNGSVLVYASVALFGKFLHAKGRMIAFAVTMFLCFEFTHFSAICFMFGMILAQNDLEGFDKPYLARIPENRRPLLFNGIFILAWYLLSEIGPLVKTGQPWFGLPPNWIPWFFFHGPWIFRNMIGACLMVYASLRLPWLQNFLARFKWLGKVSFALYLTHVPLLWFVGMRLNRFFGLPVVGLDEPSIWDSIIPIPEFGPMGMTSRYVATQIVILPLNLLLSEYVTVYVDEYCIKLSKIFASRVRQRFNF